MPRALLSSLLLLCPPLAVAAQRPPAPPRDLDRYVERAMRDFGVPGLALAIVKDGRVVVARGYGVERLGDPSPVQADRTLFGIASNTKVMTAAALGLLVERGQLAWDRPVIDYLPWFAMHDPYVTRELTIRDLLVHRSGLGLGAGDLLWWPGSTYDRKEIVRRLRYLKPATSFRSAYAYDNVLYSVAGEVIEAVTGEPWETFVGRELLGRAGMTRSTTGGRAAFRSGRMSGTHARVDGVLVPVAADTTDNTNPAGGVHATAADIAKWLLVLADSGRAADGTQVYSTATARELSTLVTPIRPGPAPKELAPLGANFNGYGLGLFLRDYRGVKVHTHTGGLPGFVSRITTVPSQRLAIAVLLNSEGGEAFEAITWHVVDHYLGAPPFDWLGGFRWRRARSDSAVAAANAAAAAGRDSTRGPSLPLARYAGTYTDSWYGDVEVTDAGGRLRIRFTKSPDLVGDLVHWQYDTFLARWDDRRLRADAYVTFQLGADGGVEQAKMAPASPDVDFSFDFQDLLLRPARAAR